MKQKGRHSGAYPYKECAFCSEVGKDKELAEKCMACATVFKEVDTNVV